MNGRGTCSLLSLIVLAASACGSPGEEEPSGAPPKGSPSSSDAATRSALASPAYRSSKQRIQQLYQAGRLDDARAAASSAVSLVPRAREPWETLSSIYEQMGADQRAVEYFAAAVGQHGGNPHPVHYRAKHQYRLNFWDAAREGFLEALELDPGLAPTHFALGNTLHRLGQFDEALTHFREAYRLDASSVLHAARLGRALRIVGAYDEAEAVIVAALQRFDRASELHYALAQLHIRAGLHDEAEGELRKAVGLDPAHARAYSDLARLLIRAGKQGEAERSLARAARLREAQRFRIFLRGRLSLMPEHPDVPLLLAELELSEKKIDAALRWFARSAALGAPERRVAAGQAWALMFLGQRGSGEAALARLGDWENPRADLARAALALLDKDHDEAARLTSRAVVAGPQEKVFLWAAADLLEYAGQPEEAYRTLLSGNAAAFPRAPTAPLVVGDGGTIEEIKVDF